MWLDTDNASSVRKLIGSAAVPEISYPAVSLAAHDSLSDVKVMLDCMLEMLEALQCGGIVRSASQAVIAVNRTAMALLGDARRNGRPAAQSELAARFESLLQDAEPQAGVGEGSSLATVWRETGRPLVISKLPVHLPCRRTILALVSLDRFAQPNVQTLQRLFGLTPAEVKLAWAIARGTAPTDLAVELDVSRTTIRSHLASVFAKTQTRRQAELVALLARVALLP